MRRKILGWSLVVLGIGIPIGSALILLVIERDVWVPVGVVAAAVIFSVMIIKGADMIG